MIGIRSPSWSFVIANCPVSAAKIQLGSLSLAIFATPGWLRIWLQTLYLNEPGSLEIFGFIAFYPATIDQQIRQSINFGPNFRPV